MHNSTENQTETTQNQSNTAVLQRFYASNSFDDAPIWPFGELWTHTPDNDTSWIHVHNHLELGRCISGSGIFNIDGKIHRFHAPCYSIIYEGQWHSAQSNPYDRSVWNFLSIDLNGFLTKVDASFSESVKGLNWRNYDFPNIIKKSDSPEIAAITDCIFDENTGNKENMLDTVTGLLISLLLVHSRLMTPAVRSEHDPRMVERVAPALTYINAHYSENITVKQLADLCFVSEATLRRYFSTFSGMSPLDYVQQTRIKNAAVMLLTTQKSVLDIAYETGYPTVSCFARQFAKLYDMSPRAYRISHRKK